MSVEPITQQASEFRAMFQKLRDEVGKVMVGHKEIVDGVLTDDRKVIRFDNASNAQAKKFIADLKQAKDIKVSVTGNLNGDTIAVNKIELQ